MKLLITIIMTLLLGAPFRAYGQMSDGYQSITANSFKDSVPTVRPEILACIANWQFYSEKRTGFKENLVQMAAASGSVLILEIGGSGFGRYDFVIWNGHEMRSSFAGPKYLRNDELQEILSSLDMTSNKEFVDPGTPGQDDGECYFLTVQKGGMQRRSVVYGTPGTTKIGRIIKKILGLAGSH